MWLNRLMARWQGALLSLIGIVATMWLGVTDQLGLYIHPRYFAFSVIMAVVAAAIVIVSFALPHDEHNGHEHATDHSALDAHEDQHVRKPDRAWTRIWGGVSVLLVVASGVALLALPPTTLTTATLQQRDLNGFAGDLTDTASAALVSGGSSTNFTGDSSNFTVKDWASLLRQGAGPDFFAGKTANITGFVTPDKDDPENVFYVARFVVSHCVVDAQPVGVPVYRPGWQEEYALDSWVGVSGALSTNPSVASSEAIVILPEEVAAIEQPQQPYVY